MRPLRARYARIEQLVRHVMTENGVTAPFVDVEKIIKRMGIEVRRGDLGEVSGLLVRTSDASVIGVNSEQSRTRQRFTLAHELGHMLLHDGIQSHVDKDYRVNFRSDESSLATNVEEIEANQFAASLLMPKEFLERDDAISVVDSDKGVSDLAARYRVSPHAMSLRLGNLYRRHLPF